MACPLHLPWRLPPSGHIKVSHITCFCPMFFSQGVTIHEAVVICLTVTEVELKLTTSGATAPQNAFSHRPLFRVSERPKICGFISQKQNKLRRSFCILPDNFCHSIRIWKNIPLGVEVRGYSAPKTLPEAKI